MALRWKKNPRPTGLAGVVAGPQGSTLRDGDENYARTGFISKRHGHKVEGWYFTARNDKAGVRLKNTCYEPVADENAAKAAALAYVRECLKAVRPTPTHSSEAGAGQAGQVAKAELIYQVKQTLGASIWCDVSKAEFDSAAERPNLRRVVYVAPTERAAAPAELSDLHAGEVERMLDDDEIE